MRNSQHHEVAEPRMDSQVFIYINQLCHPDTREKAIDELYKRRDVIPDLGVFLWHSFGSISAMIQEIINVYPYLSPATLTPEKSERACKAISLLRNVASHEQCRIALLRAEIPIHLYPFMNSASSELRFEPIRIASLNVFAGLLKDCSPDVVIALLHTEIVPLCLRLMERGTEGVKSMSCFVFLKIISSEVGLDYVCTTYLRFSHVAIILGKMVLALVEDKSTRLLKTVVRCYTRLSANPRARESLQKCLPDQLNDGTFDQCMYNDRELQESYTRLRMILFPEAMPLVQYVTARTDPRLVRYQ